MMLETSLDYCRIYWRKTDRIKMKKSLVKSSKFLSLVLRHDPCAAGLTLDPNGWADIDALIGGASRKGINLNRDILKEIVDTNEKKRFCLSEDGSRIRANQGHSISVDVELEKREPPEFLYHGTTIRFLESIQKEGLKKMNRQHVHLSADEATAIKVGSRHGKPIVLKVRTRDMNNDGFDFYLSENGVWLTDEVPFCFIEE